MIIATDDQTIHFRKIIQPQKRPSMKCQFNTMEYHENDLKKHLLSIHYVLDFGDKRTSKTSNMTVAYHAQ